METTNLFILALAAFFIGMVLVVMIVSSLKQSSRNIYSQYIRERYSNVDNPEFEEYVREKEPKSRSFLSVLLLIASLVGLFGAFAEFSGFSLRDTFNNVPPNKYQMQTQLQQMQIELKENINYDILAIKNELADTNKTKEIRNIDSILLRFSRIEKNIDSLQNLYNQDTDKWPITLPIRLKCFTNSVRSYLAVSIIFLNDS